VGRCLRRPDRGADRGLSDDRRADRARSETDWREAAKRSPGLSLDSVEILPPATTPCRVFCQGANYRQHMIESGMNPDAKTFNMFFTKSDASITSASAIVHRPAHVKLLDYEIELALVFRRSIRS
jgi:2-keto-4-pentenoate hydratase/2-oxohepta-3-ene-1,7-dioic acid hydratase in catechol pathway